LGSYLEDVPENTAATAYDVALSGLTVTDFFKTNPTNGGAYNNAFGSLYDTFHEKYVEVDLSACTGTAIQDTGTSSYSSYMNVVQYLVSIKLPSSVTRIGEYAFYSYNTTTTTSYSSLVSVTLPSGLQEIGARAFDGCKVIGSLSIPDSVTAIGTYAFNGCAALTLTGGLPSSITEIASATFTGCTSLVVDTIPSGVTSIGINAFDSCKGLVSVEIPATVITIAANAFKSCTNLTTITLKRYVSGDDPITALANKNAIPSQTVNIYVPDADAEEAYEVAAVWKTIASFATKIKVLS
jgi:hypothetical protein